jgi:hypothetical protein
MMREVPPAEREFATGVARVICAYRWREGEPGSHRPDDPCPICVRFVYEDLHGLIGQLLFAAYVSGREDDGPEMADFTAVVTDLAERGTQICQDYLDRVVQSDPRTFEGRRTRSRTEYVDVVFAVKEHPDGTPWIMPEPRGRTLSLLKAGDILGLTFREGISLKEAQSLAQEMQAKLRGLSYMKAGS